MLGTLKMNLQNIHLNTKNSIASQSILHSHKLSMRLQMYKLNTDIDMMNKKIQKDMYSLDS